MTTGHRLTLDTLPAAFAQARGETADREWAELVIGRFFLDGINQTLVVEELGKVLGLVRESGEGPDELFGEAVDYVGEQIEQWQAEDAPLAPAEPRTSWWEVPALAATVGTLIVGMQLVLEAVSGSWTTSYTIGKVLMPMLTGITAIVSITTFESLLMRTRRLWAVAGALVPATLGGATIVATFVLGNDRPLLTGPLWWYVGLVAVHALTAVTLVRYLPDGHVVRARRQPEARNDGSPSPTTGVVSDEEWAAQLAGLLRLRAEMPETDVRSTIAEVRQHATTSGTSLAQEFGSPSAYASRLPRSTSGRRMRERWRRTAWVLAVPSFGYLAFEGLQHGWEGGNVRWIMAFAFVVACLTVAGFLRTSTPDAGNRRSRS